MKKVLFYISVISLLIEVCIIFSLISGDEESTELSLRDNSVLVEYVPPVRPKVTVVTQNRDELVSQARIKYMRVRRAAAKEFVASQQGLSRPTAIVVNLSKFAGSADKVVKKKETGSVSKKTLRLIDTKKVSGIAWFMPEFSEENPNSPIKVPSVEKWLGGDGKTLAQRIGNSNRALVNYFAMISVLDESGRLIAGPLPVEIHDRGPSTSFKNPRADAFHKTWADLGVLDATKYPNSDNHRVNLVVSLVPKNQVEQLTSESGGEKFILPSWDSQENTIASNP